VFVCEVAGRTGVYFLKSYVGFEEFVGAKILYALALPDRPGQSAGQGRNKKFILDNRSNMIYIDI
jgi:hypothetical protein